MSGFLTGITTEEVRKKVATTVVPFGHSHERMMDGVAGDLLALYLFQTRTDILLQVLVFDLFLTVRDLGVLPTGQFLVPGKMQAVSVEEPRTVEECTEFGIMMQRIPRRQQVVGEVSQLVIDTRQFGFPLLIVHEKINGFVRTELLGLRQDNAVFLLCLNGRKDR